VIKLSQLKRKTEGMSSCSISPGKEDHYGVRNMRSKENKKDHEELHKENKEDDKGKMNVHMTGAD
jgi:hypothetical protein